MDHLHRLRTHGARALFQVEFRVDRDHKNIVLPVVAERDQRLEHLLMRKTQQICRGGSVGKFIALVLPMLKGDLLFLQNTHRVGLCLFFSHTVS